jgi:hypothetical protein
VAEDPGQGLRRRTGQDAENQLSASEVRPDVRSDALEHLGLDARGGSRRASDGVGIRGDGPDPVLALECLPPLSARVAGDDLRSGATRPSRSRPAIIASAITPEPTVAIVAFERGGTAGV